MSSNPVRLPILRPSVGCSFAGVLRHRVTGPGSARGPAPVQWGPEAAHAGGSADVGAGVQPGPGAPVTTGGPPGPGSPYARPGPPR